MTTRMQRLRLKETRRLWAVLLAGKMLGIVTVLSLMKGFSWYFVSHAGAGTLGDVTHQANDIINPLNTVWVLVTAFLVFFMQAGFMALEAGFARSREAVNAVMSCVFDTCVCGIFYWAIGFAVQFGAGNGVIGHQLFFLHQGGNAAYPGTQGAL